VIMAYPKLPSVSKILNKTQSIEKKTMLANWRARVGESEAEAIIANSKVRGEVIHALIEERLKGNEPAIQQRYDTEYLETLEVFKYWEQMDLLLPKIEYPFAIEQPVIHGELDYQGRFDLLAYWEGKLTIIDFKTKSKPVLETWLEDDFTQLAAYAGAIEYARPELKVEQGLIIALTPNGKQLFVLDKEQLNGFWNAWLLRLLDYGVEESVVTPYLQIG